MKWFQQIEVPLQLLPGCLQLFHVNITLINCHQGVYWYVKLNSTRTWSQAYALETQESERLRMHSIWCINLSSWFLGGFPQLSVPKPWRWGTPDVLKFKVQKKHWCQKRYGAKKVKRVPVGSRPMRLLPVSPMHTAWARQKAQLPWTSWTRSPKALRTLWLRWSGPQPSLLAVRPHINKYLK